MLRELTGTETLYVSGGLSIPEEPTEAEIRALMGLQGLSRIMKSEVLSGIGGKRPFRRSHGHVWR